MSFSFDSGQFPLLCFGGFILVFLAAITLALVSSRKQKKSMLAAASQTGFNPDPNPDPAFVEELRKVFAPSRLNRITNVSKRLFGDETLYLFDLSSENTGSSEHQTEIEYGILAVFSPHLNLPHFFLVNRLQAPGFLGPMLNNLLETGIARLGLKYYQNVPPEFDAKYILYVEDETRAEELFTDSTLSQLARMDQMNLRGCGRALVLSRSAFSQGTTIDSARLTDLVTQLRSVTDLLVF